MPLQIIPELCETPEIDPEEWPVVAHANWSFMVDGGRFIDHQMHVRRNAEGAVLAYVSKKDGEDVQPMRGRGPRAPRDNNDLANLLWKAAGDVRGNQFLVETCLNQILRNRQS